MWFIGVVYLGVPLPPKTVFKVGLATTIAMIKITTRLASLTGEIVAITLCLDGINTALIAFAWSPEQLKNVIFID